MDVYTLVGIRNSSFDGKDGSPVTGVTLHFTYPQDSVEGVAVERVFVVSKRFSKLSFVPEIGSACVLRWNKFGKLEDIEKA